MLEDIIRNIVREEIRGNNEHLELKMHHLVSSIPFAAYMGNNTILTKSYFNVMYLVSSFDSIVAPYLIKNGVYETELTKYFLNNLKPDSVFVDVGANIGYYTCLAAKNITTGKVFAFEANANAYQLLERNVMINWVDCPVILEQIAVSEEKGEVLFKNYKYRFVNSQMTTFEETGDINEYEMVKVNTIRLDDYFQSGQKVDFMKIDVEGAELKVLNGALRLIDENPNIQIVLEWSINQLQMQEADPNIILKIFSERGFSPYTLDWRDGSRKAVTYDFLMNSGYLSSVLFERPNN